MLVSQQILPFKEEDNTNDHNVNNAICLPNIVGLSNATTKRILSSVHCLRAFRQISGFNSNTVIDKNKTDRLCCENGNGVTKMINKSSKSNNNGLAFMINE